MVPAIDVPFTTQLNTAWSSVLFQPGRTSVGKEPIIARRDHPEAGQTRPTPAACAYLPGSSMKAIWMCISDLQGKVVASSYLDATTMNSGISLLSRIDTRKGPAPSPSLAAGLVSSLSSPPCRAASGFTVPDGSAGTVAAAIGETVAGVAPAGDKVVASDVGATSIGSAAAVAVVAAGSGEPAACDSPLAASVESAVVVSFVGAAASASADDATSFDAEGDGVAAAAASGCDGEGVGESLPLVAAGCSSNFGGSFARLLLLFPFPLLLLPFVGIASSGVPYLMPTSLS